MIRVWMIRVWMIPARTAVDSHGGFVIAAVVVVGIAALIILKKRKKAKAAKKEQELWDSWDDEIKTSADNGAAAGSSKETPDNKGV